MCTEPYQKIINHLKSIQSKISTKKTSLTFDEEKQSYILTYDIFSSENYIPISVRKFLSEKNIFHALKTYFEIDEELSKVYLKQEVPLSYKKSTLRELSLDFHLLSKKYLEILSQKAKEDEVFV